MADLNDVFTGAASVISAHTADTGESWTALTDASNKDIELDGSGTVWGHGLAGQLAVWYSSWTPPGADYDVTVTASAMSQSGDLGVIGRMTGTTWSGGSYYLARYEPGTGYQLFKNVTGSYTQLGSTVTGTAIANNDTLTLRMAGTAISLLKNGSSVIGPITDSALSGAGKVGLWMTGEMTSTTGLHATRITAGASSSALTAGVATAVVASNTSVTLTATDATGGTGPYTYQWYASTSSGFTPGGGNILSGKTTRSETATGLTSNTTYYFKLVYTDSASATVTAPEVSVLVRTASTYYVASGGSDSANGTSTGTPWQTLGKIASYGQVAGDTFLLNGGDAFSASLHLTASGTAGNRITVGKYGSGAPIISCSNSYGVWLDDAAYVTVQDLTITGSGVSSSGVTTSTDSGIKVTLAGSSDLAGIVIRRNTISGTFYGIKLEVGTSNAHSIVPPVVAGNTISACGFAGIVTWQKPVGAAHTTRLTAPYVAYNTVSTIYGATNTALTAQGDFASGTQSGFGCFLGNWTGGTFEGNLIHHTGQASYSGSTGGPVGVELYECNGVTVRSNEVHDAYTTEGLDGHGIDLDGGCVNCVVERNYIHECDGPAFMDLPLGGFTANSGNVFRWNISQNNGLRLHQASGGNHATLIVVGASSGTLVHNNTDYALKASATETRTIADVSSAVGCIIRNNAFTTDGSGQLFGEIGAGTTLQGNSYNAVNSSTFSLKAGSTTYTSLATLQAAGFEKISGVAVGITSSPSFASVGGGGSYAAGAARSSLLAYDPASNSPLLSGGIDLASTFGTDPGPGDFHGGPARTAAGEYPIGAVAASQPTGVGGGGPTYFSY